MKIALLGYGRMGKTIEQLATDRGHEIVKTIDAADDSYDFNGAEVAIDFSIPSAAVANITACFEANIPVVSGTTGWLDSMTRWFRYASKIKGLLFTPQTLA